MTFQNEPFVSVLPVFSNLGKDMTVLNGKGNTVGNSYFPVFMMSVPKEEPVQGGRSQEQFRKGLGRRLQQTF